MFSGNGTIDYDVEAHTLDAHKTSAARQESTTRNLHGSAAVATALLTTTSRLIPSMLTRLPLRVKSPPRETYMVAPLSILTHIIWTASLSPPAKLGLLIFKGKSNL